MKQPDQSISDIGTREDLAKHRLQVAWEEFANAKFDFNADMYRGANNRAYYCIFHAVCAVLALEGLAFKRHKDTLVYFNKNYVHPGIFPRDLGRKIMNASEVRQASDYDAFYIASKESTQQQIETAEILLKAVEKYLYDQEQAAEELTDTSAQ